MELEIECGFNSNDETINFGSRRIADNEPYESVTFASLRAKANNPGTTSIISKLNGDQLFCSVDNVFVVFQDEEFSTLKFSCTLDNIIDEYCYCSTRELLFVFLRDGSLQIFKDSSGTFCSLTTCHIMQKPEPLIEKLFIGAHFMDSEQIDSPILVVSSNGKILRLNISNTSEISVLHEVIYEIQGSINLSAYEDSMLFLHGSKMWALDLLNDYLLSTRALGIKYAAFAGTMLLTLLHSGQMAYVCPNTLLHFFRSDIKYPIESMCIINNDRGDMKYINAVSNKDSSGNVHLYLFRLDFSIIYTLTIGNDVILIHPESEIHEMRYISLMKTKNEVIELLFQCVIETDPQKRLKRLLRRNMFEEAENFAKMENLDVDIVSKEKARLITEKWKITKQDIDKLISIFETLKDIPFILDCCLILENTCESAEDLMRVLKYGCDLQVSRKDDLAKERQYQCNNLLIRLNLFCLLGESDMVRWNSFSNGSLIDTVKKLLKQEKMFEAITLYNHLAPKEIEELNKTSIKEILDILDGIDLYVVCSILTEFITVTLDWLPSSLQLFMHWLETKIYQLETQDSGNFPENAIEFLRLNSDCFKLKNPHQDMCKSIVANCSKKFQTLSKVLNKMKLLKTQYGVVVTLNNMMQEPEIVVRNLLDLTLPMDVYNSLQQHFTYQYILENELNPDELFHDAIIDILKNYESYWSSIIGSILSCITSHDVKLQAIENMLTRAKLPWSDTVKQIAIQVLKECYPKTGNVQQLMADEPRMIVLNRLEYNFDITNSSNIDDLQFMVRRIILCNLPSVVSDAFILGEDKESYKVETMRLLLHHFIEIGDFVNVLKLLEEDGIIVKKGLEFVLADVDFLSEIWTTSTAQNYAHILNSSKLMEKYSSLCENEFDLYTWKKRTNSVLTLCNMKKDFNVDIKMMNISGSKERTSLIEKMRSHIVDNYENGTQSVSEVLNSLELLSTNINIKKEKLFSQCWRAINVNKNEFLLRVAEKLLAESVEIKYLCILAVYILKNLYNENGCQFMESSFIDAFSPNMSDKYSEELLKLASQLISKAIWNADSHQLQECLALLPWVDCIHFFNKFKRQDESDFMLEDQKKSFNTSFTSLLTIQNVFTLYTSFIAQYRNANYKYLSYYNQNEEKMSEETLLTKIKDLETLFQALIQEGESLLAYKLLTTLQTCLKDQKDLDVQINQALTAMIKEHLIPNLVQQSQVMEDIKLNLLHTSLLWCDKKETEKFIVCAMQQNRKIPQRVTTLSALAVEMFGYHQNYELTSYFQQVILSVSWWERIKHLGIEYDLFFKVDSEKRLQLIIQSEKFDVKLIKDYCKEYNLVNIEKFYLFYLQTCLLNWKPKYEIETNDIGRKKLIMKENQSKELYHKCSEVIKYINDKEKIEKMLKEIWSKVNFYFYEVFTCILDLSKEHSFKHLKLMLQFLENYERINKPCDIEVEKWFNTFPNCQFIEPLSEFRLLFNSTLLESKDIWNIIRKEISLENYTKWFEAVQAFSFLNIDNICSFLVKELVAQDRLKIIKPGDWVVAKHTHLFNEIDNCLDYMKDDMKKITAAYYLLSNTPEGADQVTIATIAHKYAEAYKVISTDSSEISFSKIEKKYQKCLCLQILHIHDLAEQHYIDLILNINQLLLALYQDDRIICKMNNFYEYCPDINTAAEKLAKVFNFDITQFKKKLVTNYLMDSTLTDLSEDITIEYLTKLHFNEKTEKERSENNFKRAAYICSADIYLWHKYLWHTEYKSDKSDFYRARCVKCLLSFSDKIAISALCSQSYESIIDILDELTLSSILSKFGLQIKLHDMSTWSTTIKKLALIGSRDGVLALAQVCKILKIKKLKYWEHIIGSMDRYKMYSEMVEFLEYIKTEDYKYEKFYVDAWSNFIHHKVNEILVNETRVEDEISKDLIILQHCPVIFLLNLKSIIEHCIQLKGHMVAKILLKYTPKNQVQDQDLSGKE